MTRRVGIIGFGAIAQDLVAILAAEAPPPPLSVLVRPGREDAARHALGPLGLPDDATITGDLRTFLGTRPGVVAECAGHDAVARFGHAILSEGVDLIVASVGALAEEDLRARLTQAAAAHGGQLVLPPGAIGGIDILAAARLSGLSSVSYRGRKPPMAWIGTPAEAGHDLAALAEPTVIFEGNARTAATAYPKNANVAATLALAGLGMERTRVTLIADPTTRENVHEIAIVSPAVEATLRFVGRPSPRNPKTSQATSLGIARAILNRSAAVVI